MNKGLYFDFWGTLWLTELDEAQVMQVAIEAARIGICKNEADAKILMNRSRGMPAPGVCRMTRALSEICPLIIVSHTPKLALELALQNWKIRDYFTAVISTTERRESKNQALMRTVREYQVEPILYVGDSFADACMARDLNIEYVHVGSSQDYEEVFGKRSNPSCYSNFLLSLPEILEKCRQAFGLPKCSISEDGTIKVQSDDQE